MIGTAIIERLIEDYELIVLDRFDDNLSKYNLTVIKEDLCEVAKWKAHLKDVYCVIHLAAAVHSRPRTLAEEAEFTRINTVATAALFGACAEMGVSRVLFFSTNSVYPDSEISLDENAPIHPQGVYGRSKFDAEREAQDVIKSTGMPICIFRPASVYGARDRGSMKSLVGLCKKGIVPVTGGGGNTKALTYVRDIAGAAACYARHENPFSGQAFNIASGNYTFIEMLDAIGEAYSLHPKRIFLPAFITAPFLRGIPPINMLAVAASSKAVSFEKMEQVLGYSPRYTLRDGLRDCREYYVGDIV